MAETVYRRETNAKEEWIEMNDDGSVTHHVENSGWNIVRKGAQPNQTKYTLDEAKAKWPSLSRELDAAAQKVKG